MKFTSYSVSSFEFIIFSQVYNSKRLEIHVQHVKHFILAVALQLDYYVNFNIKSIKALIANFSLCSLNFRMCLIGNPHLLGRKSVTYNPKKSLNIFFLLKPLININYSGQKQIQTLLYVLVYAGSSEF